MKKDCKKHRVSCCHLNHKYDHILRIQLTAFIEVSCGIDKASTDDSIDDYDELLLLLSLKNFPRESRHTCSSFVIAVCCCCWCCSLCRDSWGNLGAKSYVGAGRRVKEVWAEEGEGDIISMPYPAATSSKSRSLLKSRRAGDIGKEMPALFAAFPSIYLSL